MTCPGNHEEAQGFLQYLYRFMLQPSNSGLTPTGVPGLAGGLPNSMYFSWNVGLVHFVAVSTEAYFFYAGAAAQYAWLEADLASVNRSATPWLIVYGHRSIYCSCDSDCDADATTVREGAQGLEALFMRFGVDLWINGHEVRLMGRRRTGGEGRS
jgi:acid phosphatase type 7